MARGCRMGGQSDRKPLSLRLGTLSVDSSTPKAREKPAAGPGQAISSLPAGKRGCGRKNPSPLPWRKKLLICIGTDDIRALERSDGLFRLYVSLPLLQIGLNAESR